LTRASRARDTRRVTAAPWPWWRSLALLAVDGLGAVGLGVLLVPFIPLAIGIPIVLFAALVLVGLWPGRAASAWIVVPCLAVFLPLGGAECFARWEVATGRRPQPAPMETMRDRSTEDWRLAHITADDLREFDPVLWWRPVARSPYNRQHFRGPVMAVPKPAGVLRIMAYGDSNTDGPPRGGWVERLGRLVARDAPRPVEVVNAGCAGYSSHQGLGRFRQDAPIYTPDLVLVSFGWNDLPPSANGSDRDFRPPGPVRATVLRFLLRYDAFLFLRESRAPPRTPPRGARPRVSLPEFVENLEAFLREGRRRHARVVLLTRPHEARTDEIRRQATWRAHVPEYNDAIRALAREGATVVDVQGFFEARPRDLFIDECHFTSAGHDVMARFVRDELVHQGLLP
jgi:lysophospholipase L1-like esterase